ncbi:hypothetical protein BKA70DRAFT_1319132 [Coprinopsis sp. MPI-PUGE-AT-0042]|nr:hypothetical protein BKA70DRAFT_1319132 [Coprinopsis sp. MPI-PUGE-AT-0042]
MRAAAFFLLLPVLAVQAQVTLLLPPPGSDTSPDDTVYVADVGATEGGLSTYVIHPSDPAEEGPFPATITVVQGASQVSAHYAIPEASYTVDLFCSWSADNTAEATCTGADPGEEVATSTVSLSATTLEIGTTIGAAATSGPSASSGASATPSPSAGSTRPVSPGASSSGTDAPEQSEEPGSASRTGVSAFILTATLASFWLL